MYLIYWVLLNLWTITNGFLIPKLFVFLVKIRDLRLICLSEDHPRIQNSVLCQAITLVRLYTEFNSCWLISLEAYRIDSVRQWQGHFNQSEVTIISSSVQQSFLCGHHLTLIWLLCGFKFSLNFGSCSPDKSVHFIHNLVICIMKVDKKSFGNFSNILAVKYVYASWLPHVPCLGCTHPQ